MLTQLYKKEFFYLEKGCDKLKPVGKALLVFSCNMLYWRFLLSYFITFSLLLLSSHFLHVATVCFSHLSYLRLKWLFPIFRFIITISWYCEPNVKITSRHCFLPINSIFFIDYGDMATAAENKSCKIDLRQFWFLPINFIVLLRSIFLT